MIQKFTTGDQLLASLLRYCSDKGSRWGRKEAMNPPLGG